METTPPSENPLTDGYLAAVRIAAQLRVEKDVSAVFVMGGGSVTVGALYDAIMSPTVVLAMANELTQLRAERRPERALLKEAK